MFALCCEGHLVMYLFIWTVLGLHCCSGFSLVAASGGYSLLVVSRPLIVGASLIAGHEPSCSAACGIFLSQGSNLCPLHWQADF